MLLKNARILVIDDDPDVLVALRILLKSKVKEVVTEKNQNAIQHLLSKNKFDVIILDMNFNGLVNTGNEGLFWLNKIKQVSSRAESPKYIKPFLRMSISLPTLRRLKSIGKN